MPPSPHVAQNGDLDNFQNDFKLEAKSLPQKDQNQNHKDMQHNIFMCEIMPVIQCAKMQ